MSKKQFIWNYLKNSPWYMWIIRIFAAILLFSAILKLK